ncbi:MAG TPA: hypothetical protein PL048_00690 [Leptospiraceae bacterium]|nr:hypothetical protein [Leptospiraceae bacterium]HNH08808.1 hypothetical protein [Leptospiraceae bacterium]
MTNLLISIHGINPVSEPKDLTKQFRDFFGRLSLSNRNLAALFPEENRLYIQWGQPLPDSPVTDLNTLGYAQQKIYELCNYDSVRTNPSPNSILLHQILSTDPVMLSKLAILMRENLVLFGFGDAVYYSSDEGEKIVRGFIYEQILNLLEKHKNDSEIRLHFIGHSLGVTVCHDLMYGLASQENDYSPDYLNYPDISSEMKKSFSFWRNELIQNGRLKIGSFTSMASQLPLFIMRKHKVMYNKILTNKKLSIQDLGILADEEKIKWQLFYDIDDVLGFCTRPLYDDSKNNIKEIQVDCGDDPLTAHIGYFTNPTVIRETAKLLERNGKA